MAVGLIGGGVVAKEEVVGTDDESAVGSEADFGIFTTTLEDEQASVCCRTGTGGNGGRTQRVRD